MFSKFFIDRPRFAIVLSIVMLASVVCINASAETGNTYNGYASIKIDKTNINQLKFYCL